MNIVETFTFTVGKYRVIQRPRFDSPGWGQYCVYLGEVLIGKCFSMPDVSACEWLEREQREQTFYAYSSAPLPDLTGARRAHTGGAHTMARNRKRGAPRKAKTLQDIEEALAWG